MNNKYQTYFEHLRTTILASGESSCIQFVPAEGDLPISSNSSSKELRLPSNHLNDPSLTRPSSIFLVLLDTSISNFFPSLYYKMVKKPTTRFPIAEDNLNVSNSSKNPTLTPMNEYLKYYSQSLQLPFIQKKKNYHTFLFLSLTYVKYMQLSTIIITYFS